MRYDNNGQPMGYGEPVDPTMYGQPDPAWAQYQQGGYSNGMPSPQEIYSQQQYMDPAQAQQQYMDPNQMQQPFMDPAQGQPYADPNQLYGDPQQGMYGQQPLQQDPYGQYPQSGYLDPDMAMGGMQGAYPDMDPTQAQQPFMDPAQGQPYADPNQLYGDPQQGMYGQQPLQEQMQQGYPGMQQPYGQMQGGMSQHTPQAQPAPAQQAMPQQPQPEPPLDKKAAKKAAKAQKQAAKQQSAPVNLGPEPSAGKATLCMILGILSVVFALIPPIGIVLGIVVRKMSKSYMAQGGRSPKAETGQIFATVGLIFAVILLLVLIFLIVFVYAGLYGESQARSWSVFYNNSPFGNIWRIPIPSPLG